MSFFQATMSNQVNLDLLIVRNFEPIEQLCNDIASGNLKHFSCVRDSEYRDLSGMDVWLPNEPPQIRYVALDSDIWNETNLLLVLSAIKSNKNITRLTIRKMRFMPSLQLREIFQSISSNTSLVYLCLQWCDFNVISNLFIEELSNNTTLKTLNMKGNQIVTKAGLYSLTQLLQKNKVLQTLTVGIYLMSYFETGCSFNINQNDVDVFSKRCLENYTILNFNISLIASYSADLDADFKEKMAQIATRNDLLRWKNVHALISDIVIAFSLLELPVYVLLFIVDAFPYLEIVHSQFKKVKLIESLTNSIQNVKAQRLKK